MIITEVSGGRGKLPGDAALALARMDARFGTVPTTELGRTRERQLHLYNGWVRQLPGFNRALHPDDPLANHVLAVGRRGAMDTEAVALGFISEADMIAHGWYRTASDEYWHYEYFADRDEHRLDEIIANAGKGYSMETIILREDGVVFHITPVKAYAFKDVGDYNAYRKVIRASGVSTSMLKPPAITSLKKMPAWRVKAIADRVGVTLPK